MEGILVVFWVVLGLLVFVGGICVIEWVFRMLREDKKREREVV